jgi:hypothetical protein
MKLASALRRALEFAARRAQSRIEPIDLGRAEFG